MSRHTKTADCYSKGERGLMQWSQQVRQRWLAKPLQWMTRWGITPNQLTLFSMLAGVAFAPIFLFSKPVALGCLATHLLLDGLDGPLARFQETDSPKGSFKDTLCDQIVVTTTTICLMMPSVAMIDVSAGGCYIFSYAVVVCFAMIRNAMAIPYTLLIRLRLVIYLWIVVELIFSIGWINYLIWISNLFLATKILTGFVKIRHDL